MPTSTLRNLAAAASAAAFTVLAGCGPDRATPRAPTEPPTLARATQTASLSQRAAAKGMFFGAAVARSRMERDRPFADKVAVESNVIVPEWEMKWDYLRPTPTTWDWAASDWLVSWAQARNIKVRGHALVWHLALPAWFDGTVTRENAQAYLEGHIAAVMGRYKGKVGSWDVVNEAMEPQEQDLFGWRVSSPWYKLLGPQYVAMAFRAANAADPAAQLVYNEYGLEDPHEYGQNRRAAVLRLLRDLKAQGVPVHALGTQAHIDGWLKDKFPTAAYTAFLDSVSALGLKVIVTELDVDDRAFPGDIATRDRGVADSYAKLLEVAFSHPAVTGLITWGLSDKYTWLASWAPRSDGLAQRPLPLDAQMTRKPAWTAIANAFDAAPSR